jgi:hypothetical protein
MQVSREETLANKLQSTCRSKTNQDANLEWCWNKKNRRTKYADEKKVVTRSRESLEAASDGLEHKEMYKTENVAYAI